MTCKDCIHSGLCYKENNYDNFPYRCGSFISDKVLEDFKVLKSRVNMVCFDCVHCKVCALYKRYNAPCDYYEERKKKGSGSDMKGDIK